MDERLLDLYNAELRHLRETAAEFGRDFPKIAGRLALDLDAKNECQDPYVERLLEGFAFLAARVHLKLDAEYPRFTQGLHETVYPDYLCPVPSMAIVKVEPEENDGALAPGFVIKRGTLMRSQLSKGERTACTFSTAMDVRLLPLSIAEARYFIRDLAELNLPRELGARAAFRIRLRKTISEPFKQVIADPLILHLRGADELPGQIYEQIFGHKLKLAVYSPASKKVCGVFDASSIRRVGFAPEHALLPAVAHGFEGYRLLREYFAFPARYLFLELAGFQEAFAQATGDEVDLIIALDEPDTRLEGRVDKTCFDLFCTPAINLFEKTLDRILLSNRFSEFHIVADRNRPLDFEIYQVSSVTGYGETPDQERQFQPFYQARDTDLDSSAFYTLHRVPRLFSDRERLTNRRSSYAGTDVFISIVDGDMAPCRTDLRQLGIRALCTNRHLPIQMAKGVGRTDFTTDLSGPISCIRVIHGPTLPRPSLVLAGQNLDNPQVASGRFAWRLISHLSLNYLSLLDSSPDVGAQGMRDILKLYADPNDRHVLKQIDGLRHVNYKPIVRRVEMPGPITFARGLEITLAFDEAAFEGQGVFVLGSVLEQFFAKYVSLNSFTETVVTTQQRKEIMRWPAQMGRRQIL
ncbi:MAG TPA: type VI secretion system baseplate subunit TssF [Candidatus Dormibacteraeota bacterium]|nr:type VI secretion system baseplate subunit TssF [Candidatus Dormibacteraeota bacterium]